MWRYGIDLVNLNNMECRFSKTRQKDSGTVRIDNKNTKKRSFPLLRIKLFIGKWIDRTC